MTRRIAQIALATFPSPDHLLEAAGNAYRVSQGSGTYNLKAAGTGGAGGTGAAGIYPEYGAGAGLEGEGVAGGAVYAAGVEATGAGDGTAGKGAAGA